MTSRRDFLLGGTALVAMTSCSQPVRSLLGGKNNIALGSSQEPQWNPYVTKGLVTFVDAEWNEAPLVHNESMIGANDLISGGSALTQYGTFPYLANNGKAWVKSSNASLIIDKSGILSFSTKEFTVQFCCYFTTSGVKFVIGKKFTTSYADWEKRVELSYQRLSCGTNYSWANYEFSSGWQYHSIAVTGQPSKLISLYVDGTRVKSSTINEYDGLMSSVNYLMFGGNLNVSAGNNVANQCSAGTLYNNCLIYNRALSDDECAHNYKVDKSRFGI